MKIIIIMGKIVIGNNWKDKGYKNNNGFNKYQNNFGYKDYNQFGEIESNYLIQNNYNKEKNYFNKKKGNYNYNK